MPGARSRGGSIPGRDDRRPPRPVGIGRPCRPPNLHIPFVVPVGGVLRGSSRRLSHPGYAGRFSSRSWAQAPRPYYFFQRPERQHDMNMGVAGSLVMDGGPRRTSLVHKVVLHIGPTRASCCSLTVHGQGCLNLWQAGCPLAFDLLHTVPGGWSGLQPGAGSMISA